mmetsp:Transcript_6898/g.6830  ORF Transcript_6898/g.6830 Transcript_6898/m.6830 type:complete len:105 (-) Transcript_6898:144-458(-)
MRERLISGSMRYRRQVDLGVWSPRRGKRRSNTGYQQYYSITGSPSTSRSDLDGYTKDLPTTRSDTFCYKYAVLVSFSPYLCLASYRVVYDSLAVSRHSSLPLST